MPENKISSAHNRCQTCQPAGWFTIKSCDLKFKKDVLVKNSVW